MLSCRSFIKIRNRISSKTDPWGIPDNTGGGGGGGGEGGGGTGQLVPKSTRTLVNSYPFLVNSYLSQLIPKSTRT